MNQRHDHEQTTDARAMDTDTTLIVILVLIGLMFLLLLEMYRQILKISEYYSPDAPPPAQLRFSTSFLTNRPSKRK